MNEDLHVFTIIVEQSSMNKASSLLNLSQPALSRKIAKLEEQIGSPLFDRIGKRLQLTRIGQMTYEYALEQRRLHTKYLQAVSEYSAMAHSSLTIGASLTTLQTTLPDLIQTLTEAHPELEIKAITGKTHEIVSLVREHKADIGVIASEIKDSTVQCIPLFDDHLSLVIPRNQVITQLDTMHIQDLTGMPMILFSKGTWYRLLTDELFGKYHIQPDVRMEIDSFEAILRLLHTCRAATLLPHSYMRRELLEDNELLVIPIPELLDAKRTTSLIHADTAVLNPAVRLWIKQLEDKFSIKKT